MTPTWSLTVVTAPRLTQSQDAGRVPTTGAVGASRDAGSGAGDAQWIRRLSENSALVMSENLVTPIVGRMCAGALASAAMFASYAA